jgi:hypothetical protein
MPNPDLHPTQNLRYLPWSRKMSENVRFCPPRKRCYPSGCHDRLKLPAPTDRRRGFGGLSSPDFRPITSYNGNDGLTLVCGHFTNR